MTPQEQQAFDAMREALENIAGDKWPDPEMTAEEYAREVLSAAKAVQPPAQGETVAEVCESQPFDPSGRTAKAAFLLDTSLPAGTRLYTHPQASEQACDRAYLNGLRAGFGYGISGDESGYQKSANSYRAMLAAAPEAT